MKREMSPVVILSIIMKRMPSASLGCTRFVKKYCIWITRPKARKTCSGNESCSGASGSCGPSSGSIGTPGGTILPGDSPPGMRGGSGGGGRGEGGGGKTKPSAAARAIGSSSRP